jgi:hypothetical protein
MQNQDADCTVPEAPLLYPRLEGPKSALEVAPEVPGMIRWDINSD